MLTRWKSCCCASLLLLVGACTGGMPSATRALFAAAAVWMTVASANVLNDICDVAADCIDKPWRPIPSAATGIRTAWCTFAAALLLAALFAVLAGGAVGVWVTCLAALSVLYDIWLKSTVVVGNVLVAALAAAPLSMGAHAVGSRPGGLLLGQALVFFYMLSFELVKMAVDERGDRLSGILTVATRHGAAGAVRLAGAVFVCTCCTAIALTLLSDRGAIFFGVFAGLIAFPILRKFAELRRVGDIDPAAAEVLHRTMSRAWRYGFLCLIILM